MKREWLIELRKSKGLTQEQVASAAFIDRAFYSQVETGKRNPGYNVAINIAKVLNFDVMIFFQEHLNNIPDKTTIMNNNIRASLKKISIGEILYLYNNMKIYYQHAYTFAVTGVHLGNYIFFIDTMKNTEEIHDKLLLQFNHREIDKSIFFISKEEMKELSPKNIFGKMNKQLGEIDDVKAIRVWINKEKPGHCQWLEKLDTLYNMMNKKLNDKKVLFTCSYNAKQVTADLYIKMMRIYSLLMTDYEITDSPFYSSNNHQFILPSLFIQENKKDDG